MPTPRDDETRDEFIERCIPIVIDDGTAEDGQQAYAVCSSIWRRDTKMHNKKSFKTHMKLNDEEGHEGEFTAHFWIFVVILGMIVPAILEIMELRKVKIPVVIPATLVLFGSLMLRFLISYGGQASRYLY